MFQYSSRHCLAAGTLAALGVLATCTLVAAQPNPFEAHRDAAPPKAEAGVEAQPTSAPAPQSRFGSDQRAQGTWTAGIDTMVNHTTTTNELPGGSMVDNTTLFLELSPTLGYFIVDNVELWGTIGLLSRQLDRGGENVSLETDLLLEVGGRYWLPLGDRFSLIGSLGLGGYFGSSTRQIDIQEATGGDATRTVSINEDTDTKGFEFSATLGAAYAINPATQLRAGLGLVGLIGNEVLTSVKDPLSVTTFNTGLSIGVFYVF